jgi:multiple sugar transport system substrate-binding protein/putative aldouronate transport system substrate-binding protein
MRGIKKIMTSLTALSAVSLILSGCSSTPTTEDGRITFKVYSQPSDYMGEQTGWFRDELVERFNVNFDYLSSNPSDFMLYMAQGNLGDIIIFDNVSDFRQAADAGLLLDWREDGLLDTYGTYMKENYNEAIIRSENLVEDQNLYGIGGNINKNKGVLQGLNYHPELRYDLYEQLSSPQILTLEDYIPVLKEMQNLYPVTETGKQTYGVSLFTDWDQELPMFVSQTAALYGYEAFGFGFYNVKEKQWQDCLAEDGIYLRCLRFYNSLYREGLLDPDSMTQGYSEAVSKYKQGVNLFSIFDYMGSLLYNTQEHLDQGYSMASVKAKDMTPLVYEESIYGSDTIWAIGANASYPEECMEVINWLFTPEGSKLMELGPQEITDNLKEEGYPKLSASTISWNEGSGLEGDITSYAVVPASMYEMGERSEELDIIWSQVALSINNYSWNAIYSKSEEEFMDNIEKMKQEVQTYGYQDCVNFSLDEAAKRSIME